MVDTLVDINHQLMVDIIQPISTNEDIMVDIIGYPPLVYQPEYIHHYIHHINQSISTNGYLLT